MDDKILLLHIRTDYPQHFEVGSLLYDRDGFLIGLVVPEKADA